MATYCMIGGSRHGQTKTVLHGRRVMSPKLKMAGGFSGAADIGPTVPIEFEEYVIRHVPRLNREALVFAGLDDDAIDLLLDGRSCRA